MFGIGVVNMSLLQNFILFNVLFLFIVSACHTKRNKNYNKEREKTCNFKNVSVPVYNFQSNEIAVNSNFPTIYFFNASKPNIAILQCHESNVNYLSQNITVEYKNNNSDFTNSPVECMTVCQATKKCKYFTFNIRTNQCWMFTKIPVTKTPEYGYISGPKYCETQHPTIKGGFKIEGDKYWLRFNSSFLIKISENSKLPKLQSHAWEDCKRICTINKKCTSFDYCFAEEKDSFEIFKCFMKSNTIAEKLLKTPRHCVKSVKLTCSYT